MSWSRSIGFIFISAGALMPGIVSAARPSDIFKAADINHDGYVDNQENERMASISFKERDLNGDGSIDLDEMVEWMSRNVYGREGQVTQLPGVAKSVADRAIKMQDSDKDGRISYQEFLANIRKSTAMLDKDGDGRLSYEEATAYDTRPSQIP